MQTFNWFFGLGDEDQDPTMSDGKIAQPSSKPSAPPLQSQAQAAVTGIAKPAISAEHLAVTGQYAEPELAEALAKSTAAQTSASAVPKPASPLTPPAIDRVRPEAGDSATMNAYVPSVAQLQLPVATRAALKGAQVQLKGSAPMNLSNATNAANAVAAAGPARPAAGASAARRLAGWARQRLQTGLLAVATLLVLGAVVWSFYPVSPARRRQSDGPARAAGAEQVQRAASPASSPVREDPATSCLAESTAYKSGEERDQMLRNAIIEFDNGRMERAHALLKEYSGMSCDRASLDAIGMLERQLEQKIREH